MLEKNIIKLSVCCAFLFISNPSYGMPPDEKDTQMVNCRHKPIDSKLDDECVDSHQRLVQISNDDLMFWGCYIAYNYYIREKIYNERHRSHIDTIVVATEGLKATRQLFNVIYPPIKELYPQIISVGKQIYKGFYNVWYHKDIQKMDQEISLCKQYQEGWEELKCNHWWLMDWGKKYEPVKLVSEYLKYMCSLPIEERANPIPERFKTASEIVNNIANHKTYQNTNCLDDLPRRWVRTRFFGQYPSRSMNERIKYGKSK